MQISEVAVVSKFQSLTISRLHSANISESIDQHCSTSCIKYMISIQRDQWNILELIITLYENHHIRTYFYSFIWRTSKTIDGIAYHLIQPIQYPRSSNTHVYELDPRYIVNPTHSLYEFWNLLYEFYCQTAKAAFSFTTKFYCKILLS